MSKCVCGHNPCWHHFNRYAGTYHCDLCATCSRTRYQHKQSVCDFTPCKCKPKGDN